MGPLEWTLILYEQCAYKKRRLGHRQTQREDHVRTQGEDGRLQPNERGLTRSRPCWHRDRPASWTTRKRVFVVSATSSVSFVMAALEDSYVLVPNASFLVYDPAPGCPQHCLQVHDKLLWEEEEAMPSIFTALKWKTWKSLIPTKFLREEGWWWAYMGNIFTCVTLLFSTFVLSKYSANLSILQCSMQLHKLGLGLYGSWQILFGRRLPYRVPVLELVGQRELFANMHVVV